MEKTSKVVSVKNVGTWDSQNGILHKFDLTFDNGDAGQYLSKSEDQTKFVEGQEAKYTIETNKGGYQTIKPVYEQGGFKKGGYTPEPPEQKFIGFAYSYTKDLICAGKLEVVQFIDAANRTHEAMLAQLKKTSK